jgi:MFS family permease
MFGRKLKSPGEHKLQSCEMLHFLRIFNQYLLPPLAFIAALLCFSSPLVTIQYQGEPFKACTGWDLAKGEVADPQAVRAFCEKSSKLRPCVERPAGDFETLWQKHYRALEADLKSSAADDAEQAWKKDYAALREALAEEKNRIDDNELVLERAPKGLAEFVAGNELPDEADEQARLRTKVAKFTSDSPPQELKPAWEKIQAAFTKYASAGRWTARGWPLFMAAGLLGLLGELWRRKKQLASWVYLLSAVLALACFVIAFSDLTELDFWPYLSFHPAFWGMLGACVVAGASAVGTILWHLPRGSEYRVGTLRYSIFGLLYVFVLLLWGDFILQLMESELPSVLPFLLKDLHASQSSIQFILKTLGYIVSVGLAPVVGFRSDRHRGRLGRRIPYILWATPFVAAFLILMGFFKDISHSLTGANGTFLGMGPVTTAVVVIGLLMFGFHFFNYIIGTVYYCLFNDVVPQPVMARFLSFFRIIGGLAAAGYSRWIFPLIFTNRPLLKGMDNFKLVTIFLALLYTVVFVAMCFLVKEGKYPPPPENPGQRKGMLAELRTFFTECFTHRFYWYFFLVNMFLFMSWMPGTFYALRNHETLGLTYADIGWLASITGLVAMLLQYPAGWLSDKYHPVRVHFFMTILLIFNHLTNSIWIFTDFGPKGNLYAMLVVSFGVMPFNLLLGAAQMPMAMRLLPKERYGQFSSANGFFRCFFMIGGGTLMGLFMDLLMKGSTFLHVPALGDWGYRYLPLWGLAFHIPAVFIHWLLYREWKKLGGADNYKPPGCAPDQDTQASARAQCENRSSKAEPVAVA